MKAKRRAAAKGEGLEHMSDTDLQDIRFFANLVGRDRTPTFVATPDEQRRAVEILLGREALS